MSEGPTEAEALAALDDLFGGTRQFDAEATARTYLKQQRLSERHNLAWLTRALADAYAAGQKSKDEKHD